MSRAVTGVNGTCPCRSCQRALNRTPAYRELLKMHRTGRTLTRGQRDAIGINEKGEFLK